VRLEEKLKAKGGPFLESLRDRLVQLLAQKA